MNPVRSGVSPDPENDQCPACHASPTSRLALMRDHARLSRQNAEFDEWATDADALLRGAVLRLREAYTNLGLVADIEAFLGMTSEV